MEKGSWATLQNHLVETKAERTSESCTQVRLVLGLKFSVFISIQGKNVYVPELQILFLFLVFFS